MHLEPTNESVQQVMSFLPEGPFVMLNLFRLRKEADYSKYPDLKPASPVSCQKLFDSYIANMDQYLDNVGAKRTLLANGGPPLVGPSDEKWDVVQMVQYPSRQSWIDLASIDEVRTEVPLRSIMLEDSRVVPMIERSLEL